MVLAAVENYKDIIDGDLVSCMANWRSIKPTQAREMINIELKKGTITKRKYAGFDRITLAK